jgi:hypothetical protein
MTTVATFEIGYTQFLDAQGEPPQLLPSFASDSALAAVVEVARAAAVDGASG